MGDDAGALARRQRMVAGEQRQGIDDPQVLAAMAAVPREAFVPERYRSAAYEERALPIAEGQTISQPFVVAAMTQMLALRGHERVLEVGTGSGYQAAVLRHIVPHVTTIECHEELARTARDRFRVLGIDGIEVHVGDGSLGWPHAAPYDAIVVTAAAPDVPPALVDQLAPGGRLVLPVGDLTSQRLVRVVRSADGMVSRSEGEWVAFVPLVGEEGWPSR